MTIIKLISKNQKLFFISCFLFHCIETIYLGLLRNWGGDEWFSYYDFTIMGLPFSILCEIQKLIIGPITKNNFIFYKIQSLVWIGLLYSLLYYYFSIFTKTRERIYIIFLSLFLIISPYIVGQSHVFRYYNLYLLFSFLIYFIIATNKTSYVKQRKQFSLLLLFSPLIHFFLFIQLSLYMLINELISIRRNKVYLVFIILIGFLTLYNFNNIVVFIWNLYFSDYAIETAFNHRGISLGTIIKPFNTIFVFLFGKEITPFEYLEFDLVFILVGVALLFIFTNLLLKKDEIIKKLLSAAVLPLLFVFLILEPLSFPGMTQAEPQHVLFFLPWLIYLLLRLLDYHWGKILLYVITGSILHSNYLQFSKQYPDWKNVELMINENNTVITDVPKNIDFHVSADSVIWFMEKERVLDAVNQKDTLLIVMENWANYQMLSLEQKWNSGKGTKDEVQMLNVLYHTLQNNKFILTEGYSKFPLHAMLFIRQESILNKKPVLLDIKYQDITLPLFIDDKKVIGFEKLFHNESFHYEKIFYYFIQIDSKSEDEYITKIIYEDGLEDILHLNDEKDTFRKYHCRSFINDKPVYKYKKNPLVSNSMRYPGSIFKSKGSIFLHESTKKIKNISFPNNNIYLYRAILSENN